MIGLSGLITPSLGEMVHVASEMKRQGFEVPLLIGGATTSLRHTAVKVAPAYPGPVLWCKDASKAAETVSELTDDKRRAALITRTRAEQTAMAADYEARRHKQPLAPIAEARARRVPVTWRQEELARPPRLGVEVLDVDLASLVPYIDWTPFFHTWEMKGTYPSILDSADRGPQARKLKHDADEMLARLVRERWVQAKAVAGLWRAVSDGDDIVVLTDDGQGEVTRFPMLRQQQRKNASGDDSTRPYVSLSDYVAPRDAGLVDHLGAFAVTTGLGVEQIVARFKSDHDEYNAILAQALTDRLAEACAEWLHERVRARWGYDEVGGTTPEQLIREQYRGIRPAPGYPACPDHSVKRAMFEVLQATEIGMDLTDSLAMTPAASVSGFYLAHPEATYFNVGRIGEDQLKDWAARQAIEADIARRLLAPALG